MHQSKPTNCIDVDYSSQTSKERGKPIGYRLIALSKVCNVLRTKHSSSLIVKLSLIGIYTRVFCGIRKNKIYQYPALILLGIFSIGCNSEPPNMRAIPNRIVNGDNVEFIFSGSEKNRVRVYDGSAKLYDSRVKVNSDKFTIENISQAVDYKVKINSAKKKSFTNFFDDTELRYINDNEETLTINATHKDGSCTIETTKTICLVERTEDGQRRPVVEGITGKTVKNCIKEVCERKASYSVNGLEWKLPTNIVYSSSVYLSMIQNVSQYQITVETSDSKITIDAGENLSLTSQKSPSAYQIYYLKSQSTVKDLPGTGLCTDNRKQAKNCETEYDKLIERDEIKLIMKRAEEIVVNK